MPILTPSSVFAPGRKPPKSEIIQLLERIEGNALAPAVVKETLADLELVTPADEDYGGLVLDDPDPANNGYYYRDAAAWVFGRPLPETVASVTLSGSGTAQTGTAIAGVNPSAVLFYFAVVDTDNTGPLTLSIGGETARDVVNAGGSALSAGEWTGVVQFFLNEDGDYQLINDAGAAAAAAASATAADAAADRAEAAVSTTLVTTLAEFQAAIRGTSSIHLAPSLTSITLVSADVPYLLDTLHLIRADVLTDINLPAGVFTTTTGDIAHVSDSNANLRLLGAARAETTLTSVASVSGAAYDWDVVLNVADATNFAVGNVVKMWNIGPLVTLSGDNSILLRDRPLPNEIYYPHARIGAMSPGVGVATATFAAGATLSTHLAVNDLVHFQGQTNRIASIDDGTRTVTFDDNWAKGATNARNYWVTIRAVTSGTCTLASGTSDVLNFSNSITATHLNVGDLVLTRGQAHEIIAINSAAQVQLAHAATFTGGAPYSIVTPGCVHEGGHVVTAVAGNQVTVKNRSRIKPPVNRVTAGEVIAIRTVLHQTGTGDGILPQQGGVLAEINRIALRGNNSSTGSHGIAGNGRLAIGPTQNGTVSNFTMGYDTAVIEFGRNYYGTYGCTLNARGTMWSGARQYGVWADIGSTVNLRHAVANGCHSDGFLFGPGAVGKVTESRGVANGDDGFHLLNGAIMYGEIPFAWGNASMGFRNQGGHLHCNEGGSICNLDAIYVLGTKNGGSGTNMLLLGSRREAVEVDDGVFDVSGSWISGSSGSAGSGRPIAATNGSWVKAISCGVGGNKAAPIASVGSRIDLSDMNPVLAVAGVTRLNEFTAGGSIILDGAATATGFNALKVGGGSSLTFFKIATLAHDFPSIGAGATATQTVTVTGATVGMGVLVASNAVSAGITYYGYVSAADTVTIVAENNSGGSIDPGNATHTVFVFGGTV